VRDDLSRRHLLAGLTGMLAGGCLELESGEGTTAGPPTTGNGATATRRPTATDTRRPTPTATATAEPTDEPTPTATEEPSVSYPLGISDDAVSSALADTHQGVALETAFTLSYGIEPVPGPQSWTTRTHRYDPNGPVYEVVHDDEVARRHQFHRDGQTYAEVRDADAEEPAYFVTDRGVRERDLTVSDQLKTVLDAGAFRPTETHPTETPRTIDVVADGLENPTPLRETFLFESVADLTGEGVVRESGLIQSLAVSFDATHGDATERVALDLELSNVGETTVTAPDWVDVAPNRSPSFALDATDDYLTMTNDGGGPLPAETYLLVSTAADTTVNGRLDTAVPAGETLYLAVSGSGDELLSAVGDPPTGERASLESEVLVHATYRKVNVFRDRVSP